MSGLFTLVSRRSFLQSPFACSIVHGPGNVTRQNTSAPRVQCALSCTILVEQNAEGQLRIFCTSEGCCKRPWKGRDEGDTARSSRPQGTPPWGQRAGVRERPLGLSFPLRSRIRGVVELRFMGQRIYLLSDPGLIEYILVENNRNFTKTRILKRNRRLLGEGLLTSEGEFWR